MNVCPICQRGFDKTGNRQRYCSKECGSRKWSKDYYLRKKMPEPEVELTVPLTILEEIQPISDHACRCLKAMDRINDTSDPPLEVQEEVRAAIESLYAARRKWQATAC